jgi:hypothetical protein
LPVAKLDLAIPENGGYDNTGLPYPYLRLAEGSAVEAYS